MSETTSPAITPESEPAPAPQPAPAPAPSPESPQEQTEEEQHAAREKEDRRIAQLRARLGAAERDRERQQVELEFYRRQAVQQQPAEETPEQRILRERAIIRAEESTRIRAERFHEEGASQYADWKQRCDDLMAMGADPHFAQLLVETPEGVKLAAALANDPAEVQRIASLQTERARAVALGKYAATISDTPARPALPPRNVSQAPPPVRTVQGRASPVFNEYTASAQELVDHYMRKDMESRVRK